MSRKGRLLSALLRGVACFSDASSQDEDIEERKRLKGGSRTAHTVEFFASPTSAASTRTRTSDLSAEPPSCHLLDVAESDADALQEQLAVMLGKEAQAVPDGGWLAAQPPHLVQLRSRLVAWLRLATRYHSYSIITCEHAACFLDRTLCKTCFLGGNCREMQLAAVASFSLAAKMEEIWVPSLGDELQVAAPWPRFPAQEVERMELAILTALGWRLACVTPSDLVQPLLATNTAWRRRFDPAAGPGPGTPSAGSRDGCASSGRRSAEWLCEAGAHAAHLGSQVRTKAKSTLAAALGEPELTRFKPSEVAAASLIVGVHGTCPDSLAGSVQTALLARFPRAAACVAVLLQHSSHARASPARGRATAAGSSASPVAKGDTPTAKRACRAHTPTSVLDLSGQ